MFKFYLSLLIINIGFIRLISTGCSDRNLYCFNNKEELLGPIQVNQCWTWYRLSCQPCIASFTNWRTTFEEYFYQCRKFYSTTIQIHSRKSIFMDKLLQRKWYG